MMYRTFGIILACLLAAPSNAELLAQTVSATEATEAQEVSEIPVSNVVKRADGSIVETKMPSRGNDEVPENKAVEISGSTAKTPSGDTVKLPGGFIAAMSDAEAEVGTPDGPETDSDTEGISLGETGNCSEGEADGKSSSEAPEALGTETTGESSSETPEALGTETTGESSSDTSDISSSEAEKESGGETKDMAEDGAPAVEGLISLVLPLVYNTMESPLNFIMDPQGLIQETDAVGYNGASFEKDKTLFFANKNGTYDYSSQSDWLEVISQSDVPVQVTVDACVWNISDIQLTQDNSFEGDSSPSIYLALVDTDGNEIPLDSNGHAFLDIKITPKENNEVYSDTEGNETDKTFAEAGEINLVPDFYAFAMTGACNPNGDWLEITEQPYVSVTWTITPLLEESHQEDLQEPENEENANEENADEAEDAGTEESTDETEDPETEESSDKAEDPGTEESTDEAETKTEKQEATGEIETGAKDSGNMVDVTGMESEEPEGAVDKTGTESEKPENTAGGIDTEAEIPENAANETEAEIPDSSADQEITEENYSEIQKLETQIPDAETQKADRDLLPEEDTGRPN